MSDTIETDYLAVGAGTAGMAITDALLTHSDAHVTVVDRRHAPGGHWIDAYPFVRLHQPSAFYGVDSVPLGEDAIDRSGPNAGFYELAGADELRAYFAHVMQRRFLPGGRVRWVPCTDHVAAEDGGHRLVSRLTGATQRVSVRRKLVDTTWLEGRFPATDPPPFEVADGVRCVPAGEVTRIADRPARYVVIGAGKTALDTCVWLMTHGVPPVAIGWVKPRESWWLNRRFHQPLALLPDLYAGVAIQLEALARAASLDDLFLRLEAEGFFLRIDPAAGTPDMLRGAILSDAELRLLRRIENVIRLGRVRRIEPDRIVLDEGTVPTGPGTVHVHCAAYGLSNRPLRPIFEPGRITVQPCFWGFASFQFALLGAVEALVDRDEEKNRLCPPIAWWNGTVDYPMAFLAMLESERARAAHPALAAWARASRLSPLGRIGEHRDDPTVVAARERIRQFGAAAAGDVARLLSGQRGAAAAAAPLASRP